MAYLLNATSIRAPNSLSVSNSTQVAENRTLSGSITRDYFGSNKRIWTLNYENCNITEFNIINNLYTTYLNNGNVQTWQITETNYPVSSTTVHVDVVKREFSVKGTDYLSDFALVLTEA
jgi:hypothetical protein